MFCHFTDGAELFDSPQQVLCPPAPTRSQLPQEEVRSHQPAAAEEEDQVMGWVCAAML